MVGVGAGIASLALKKAELRVTQGSPRKRKLKFKYNPETFTFSKSADWSEPPQHQRDVDPAPPTHQRTNPATLQMDIFFDAYEEFRGDVTDEVLTLIDWTKPCPPETDGVMN